MRVKHSQQVTCSAFLLVLAFGVAVKAHDWNWDERPGQSLALKKGENVLWQFNYGPEQPKPLGSKSGFFPKLAHRCFFS